MSFLAAVLLYYLSISEVQGFAYTLGLTTIIDLVVVFLFTKPMVTLLAGTSSSAATVVGSTRSGSALRRRGEGPARRTVRPSGRHRRPTAAGPPPEGA